MNNPRPSPFSQCTNTGCQSPNLGPVLLCQGKGEDPQNCGRWYQMCRSCNNFLWHNPKTPLELVPDHLLMRHASKQSLADFPPGHPLNRLDCAHPNCRGKDNQPRVANRACDRFPQLCQTCCRAEGGCSKHKTKESQQSRAAEADKTASASPAPSAASSGTSLPAEPVSKFARPLTTGFGQAFAVTCQKKLASNQKAENEKKITETMGNLVVVLLWLKANSKPIRLNIVVQHAGTLVLSDQPAIIDRLHNVTLISVFKALPRPEWIEQDFSIPIAVPRIPRILCRLPSLENTDCLELEEELGVLGIQNRHFNMHTMQPGSDVALPLRRSASVVSLLESGDPVSHFTSTTSGSSKRARLSTLSPPCSPPPAPSDFNIKLPFPRMYACEMMSGFRVLNALVAGGFTLGEAFSQAFASSDFVYKTVTKHRKIYERARNAHVLELYRDMGCTPEGKWCNVVRDVTNILISDESRQPSLTPSEHQATSEADADSITDDSGPPLSPPLEASEKSPTPSLNADYGGFLTDSVIYLVTHQKFEMRGSQLTAAWTADMENLNLYTTRTPAVHGSIKRVSIGYIHEQGMYAIKRISLPGEWWTQWTSAANAIWVEASRVALCFDAACGFHQLAKNNNTALYLFRVLPTSIFVICGQFQIAQEWIEGQSKRLSAEDLILWQHTMEAFSHYTYQASGGLLLHSGFQYHSVEKPVETSVKGKAVEGATIRQAIIFDCATHTSGRLGHDSALPNIGPFLRSEGQAALANFANTHICNEVCRSLGLIPV
ncbi:hypothetical protein PLEOSDRAFT_1099136 [Pleurotus ostreatus PC15]|uniref:Alpha-type protein kinase domain-containing protein n=1 Tax=Pleurotus ostreatus (strain PC15) TaxID=1137138 RepID=A0A067NYK9_PLEO1|nr:hypothetical protein PLEOSDRAFT_1099136 [Pleurotus ostreatus PC15]